MWGTRLHNACMYMYYYVVQIVPSHFHSIVMLTLVIKPQSHRGWAQFLLVHSTVLTTAIWQESTYDSTLLRSVSATYVLMSICTVSYLLYKTCVTVCDGGSGFCSYSTGWPYTTESIWDSSKVGQRQKSLGSRVYNHTPTVICTLPRAGRYISTNYLACTSTCMCESTSNCLIYVVTQD